MKIDRLKNNGRVAVIGAGPSGSFFALHLLKLGAEKGLKFDVTIFDNKHFSDTGPKGCNMCAGAISSTLFSSLIQMGFPLPEDVIKDRITGYCIHLQGESALIKSDPSLTIHTVFRAAGPHLLKEKNIRGFDQVLLDYALGLGAVFVNERVKEIITSSKDGIGLVYGEEKKKWEGDLIVGAFGVNSKIGESLKLDYSSPVCWLACQTEIEVPEDFAKEVIQNKIHIFTSENKKIKFIAFTPKGSILTITAIGKDVKRVDLEAAMKEPDIARYLPDSYEFKCHCHPKVPVTLSENPFYNRFVIVGDASASRYLKNGIESAFYTSKWAVLTALNYGLSEEDFKKRYFSMCRKAFYFDNMCGKLLFFTYDLFSKRKWISKTKIEMVRFEQENKGEAKILSSVFWHLFTGDVPYLKILKEVLNPMLFIRFFKNFLRG